MRCQVLRRDARARYRDTSIARAPFLRPSDARLPGVPPAFHGVARVQEQVQKHLLQLAGIALDRRAALVQIEIHLDWMPFLRTGARPATASPASLCSGPPRTNSVGEVREKLSSELTISLARKVCLAIFSSSGDFCIVAEICLASIWA